MQNPNSRHFKLFEFFDHTHHGVGVLLETCLADKLAFAERNRRLIRRLVETKLEERAAGA